MHTREIMKTPHNKKKRKRKPKAAAQKAPSPYANDDSRDMMIEKLYLYISSIEVQVRAIKRVLLEYSA